MSLLARARTLRPTLFARCLVLFVAEVALNLVLWIVALIVSPPTRNSNFASLCLIAWTTGLRHGLDADHICAIDNATRRMASLPVEDGQGPTQGKSSGKERLFLWRGRRRENGTLAEAEAGHSSNDESNKPALTPTPTPTPKPTPRPTRLRQPVTCGLFFSLGHSTIVVAVTIAVAISLSVAANLEGVGSVGGIIGAAVSGSFLFIVAVINSVIFGRTLAARRRANRAAAAATTVEGEMERGGQEEHTDEAAHEHHRFTGMLTRVISPLLRTVTRPWHMYPVGVLFGLGFDTASTIALLSVASAAGRPSSHALDDDGGANSATAGITGSDGKVVLLALLFAAGMTWVDSIDSILMIYAYAPPPRRQDGRWWALVEAGDEAAQTLPTGGDQAAPAMDKDKEKAVTALTDEKQDPSKTASPETQTQLPEVPLAAAASSPASPPPSPSTSVAPSLSRSAQNLSLLLTLLSILMAFTISIIVLMGLIAEECSACARSVELHDEPERDEGGNNVDDGGLAGRWWSFWLGANDQSGYIGAGIVGLFAVVVAVFWGTRWARRRYRAGKNGSSKGGSRT